ncbi:MAG: alpha/beta hydrolase family protein [Promethearchaeota archaeon]
MKQVGRLAGWLVGGMMGLKEGRRVTRATMVRRVLIVVLSFIAVVAGAITWKISKIISFIYSLLFFSLLALLVYEMVRGTFLRFDDDPAFSDVSAGAIVEEVLRINGLFTKILKSRHTPDVGAPTVIMHHGYGSNYRRLLVYAYPLALNGFAVLLYNARGHGKIMDIDERTAGDRTHLPVIMRDLKFIVDFIKNRDDLGAIGFVGTSLGAIVGLTYGCGLPDVRCVVAMAGLHNFKKTAGRKLVPFSSDWFMKKSFEWSGLEMKPTNLQDRIVSPEFYLDKEFGFFDHPVWTSESNAGKIRLIHAEDDCTIPFSNFKENITMLNLHPEHFLALKRGNHWFIRQEHLIIGQLIHWLGEKLR